MFKWLNLVCFLRDVVLDCVGGIEDCFGEVIWLVDLLIIVVKEDINFV